MDLVPGVAGTVGGCAACVPPCVPMCSLCPLCSMFPHTACVFPVFPCAPCVPLMFLCPHVLPVFPMSLHVPHAFPVSLCAPLVPVCSPCSSYCVPTCSPCPLGSVGPGLALCFRGVLFSWGRWCRGGPDWAEEALSGAGDLGGTATSPQEIVGDAQTTREDTVLDQCGGSVIGSHAFLPVTSGVVSQRETTQLPWWWHSLSGKVVGFCPLVNNTV